jgi:methyltransferase family protein
VVLPPDFAAFTFQAGAAGGDESLADAAVAAVGPARIVAIGAGRWGLIVALARRGARVTAIDPSRAVLAVARDAIRIAGLEDSVSLFAADPRDFVVPEGADGALVPSFAWRVLLTQEAQEQALGCLRRAIAPGGALCLDVDRLPASSTRETERTFLRDGPGGQTWWWRRDPARSLVRVTCEAPRTGAIDVDVSDVSPEASAALLERAGFDVERAPAPDAPRAFLVGRNRAA